LKSDLLPEIYSPVILGMVNVTYAISLAALIFSGKLSVYLATGISILLITTIVGAFLVAVGSSLPGIVATPKGNICVVIALMAFSISNATQPDRMLPTVLAAIVTSTLLTGACLVLLGRYRIGNLFRFVPYPVIAGYFAGAGFILLTGAVPVMTGQFHGGADWLLLLESTYAVNWIPGAVMALITLLAVRHFRHFGIFPAMIVFSTLLFYGFLWASGTSIETARHAALLFETTYRQGVVCLPPVSSILAVDHQVLLSQGGNIITIVFLGIISFLLTTSAIETAINREFRTDREFKVAGTACIISSLFGGSIAFHTAVDTVFSYTLGARKRLSGILYTIICIAGIVVGPDLVSFLPRAVVGGILMYMGLDLLTTWGIESRKKMPLADYLLLVLILLVIIFFGFLEGIAAGILVAAAVFVINYSRTTVVKYSLSGSKIRSRVRRATPHRDLLLDNGERIWILVLQGYLFFGTAEKLFLQIKHKMDAGGVFHIILDFRMVTDIDSSAVNSFVRIQQAAASRSIDILFSGLKDDLRQQFDEACLENRPHPENRVAPAIYYPDLDHALEWAENQILAAVKAPDLERCTMREHLDTLLASDALADRLLNYMTRKDLAPEEALFLQGDISDDMYFIEKGEIKIILESRDGKDVRLVTMGPGTVVGEMGVYTKRPRSATARASTACTLYALSTTNFDRIQRSDPELASRFHQHIVCSLVDHLDMSNATIHNMAL